MRLSVTELNAVDGTMLAVIVVLTMICALSWLAIGLAMHMAPKAALRFASANLGLSLASALVVKRSSVSSYFNYQLGDWLVFGASALFCSGILIICKRRSFPHASHWDPLICAILSTAVVEPEHSSFIFRVFVASSVLTWYFFYSFGACFGGLKNNAFPTFARAAISWPFLVAGIVFLVRGIAVLVLAQKGVNFTLEDEMRIGPFLWFMLVLILCTNISLGGLITGRLVIRIRDLADRDYLTGCLNRRSLDARLAIELTRNHRSGEHLACVIFDIDHFKIINDTYGHDAGDAVLKHLVKVTQGIIRTVDALGRFGGEEFVVLMPATHLTGAREGAERIRLALETNPAQLGNLTITTQASFGVAVLASTESKESLLRRADEALYQAKRHGRNRVEIAKDFLNVNKLIS